jgi:hypothetical protein
LNKYQKSILIALTTLVVLIGYSCKKENQSKGDAIVSGTISLEAHAVHHSWDVYGITIYLKKNVTEFPGRDSSVYEFKGIADSYGKFTFENLYPGNYYVYASGYDAVWGDHVAGYAPVVLDNNSVQDNFAQVKITVSE